MNTEHPSLLEPGLHDVDLDTLERLFVEPFDDATRRRELLDGLRAMLSVIRRMGLRVEVWIDGSFTTQKPNPVDIDVVIYYDPIAVQALKASDQNVLSEIADTNLSKLRYKCDPYLVPNDEEQWRSYWRGWFGFSRDEEPKGIARISL
ncbi:MAG TPA: hypothetical protein VK582_02615 [Pyrinomonadaceae bacterium]|nr:hypothetical protein [Pyrinomonadaceae bacterium]